MTHAQSTKIVNTALNFQVKPTCIYAYVTQNQGSIKAIKQQEFHLAAHS